MSKTQNTGYFGSFPSPHTLPNIFVKFLSLLWQPSLSISTGTERFSTRHASVYSTPWQTYPTWRERDGGWKVGIRHRRNSKLYDFLSWRRPSGTNIEEGKFRNLKTWCVPPRLHAPSSFASAQKQHHLHGGCFLLALRLLISDLLYGRCIRRLEFTPGPLASSIWGALPKTSRPLIRLRTSTTLPKKPFSKPYPVVMKPFQSQLAMPFVF